jgi:two-component system sensor histidine kinase QseC
MTSVRARLVGAVLLAVATGLAMLALAIQSAIERGSAQEFDERLAQQARLILAYAGHEFAETGTAVPEALAPPAPAPAHEVIYQVWTVQGVSVHRSVGAPQQPMMALHRRGFADVELGGTGWRAYALASPDLPLVVQIAELASHRALIAERARHAVSTPVLVSLPLLAALVWWLTTAALAPVGRLARQISARSAGEAVPLELGSMPDEVRGLGVELNSLLARQRDALAREQRFTADAAHELRTPLAAVRAQAQVALRAQDPAQREHALRQLIAGVDRSGRLITQLLSLARLDPSRPSATGARYGIDMVLTEVLHDLEHDIVKHGLHVQQVQPLASTSLPREPVYLMLRNLIDNAIHHSPPGSTIRVVLQEERGQLRIRISDQGPGIPPERRAQVLDRFRRLNESYAGIGLGLSIVAQVVALLRGRLDMRDADPPPGLEVAIDLPVQNPGPTAPAATAAGKGQAKDST